MAIDPPSDIVLEVARAADPERAAAVARSLGTPTAGADFAAALETTRRASATPAKGVADMRANIGVADAAPDARADKARVQFEAALLNSFVGEMLPKDAPEAYGEGLPGQMWRSLLAQRIADQMAGSGALDIGRRLFATHPLASSSRLERPARGDAAGLAATAQMSANELSAPVGAAVDGGAVLFAGARPL